MDSHDAAWLAGYIDGDGSITLATRHPGQARTPELNISSTDEELIEAVMQLVQCGSVRTRPIKPGQRVGRLMWRVRGPGPVISILEFVYPHMRCSVKKERARMIVEEYATVTRRNGRYSVQESQAKGEFERRFLEIGDDRGWRRFGITGPLTQINGELPEPGKGPDC